MITAFDYISATFALFLAVAILADRAGWATPASAIARGLAVTSLGYLAILAAMPGVRP